MSKNEETRVTVRAPKRLVERLDDAIMREKLSGNVDREISRSDVIRAVMAGIIDTNDDDEPILTDDLKEGLPKYLTVEGEEIVLDWE